MEGTMKFYRIYYGDVVVGELRINEKGEYQYLIQSENVQKLVESGAPIAPPLLSEQKEFGEPISYFKVRLDANERYSHLEAGVLTDKVRIVE